MTYRIAIEISAIRGSFAENRIIKSYKYSRYGLVAMILNGISPRDVNKILDPIVPSFSLGIPGVRYIDIMAESSVTHAISSARTIVIQTPVFHEIVHLAGLDCETGEKGNRRRVISISPSLGKRMGGSQQISLLAPRGSLAR